MTALDKSQYLDLDSQYARTPPLDDGTLASGEHYQLIHLLGTFGIRVTSREEAMQTAEELLQQGWKP